MTIALTGAGGFFTRVGWFMGTALNVNSIRGGVATSQVAAGANMGTRVTTNILPAYAAGTALMQVVDGLEGTLASFQAAQASVLSDFAVRCQNTLRVMYAADVLGMDANAPLGDFANVSLTDALKVLVSQMVIASASVEEVVSAAGAQTAVGTPVGNPVIVASLFNGQGRQKQLVFPETMYFLCTEDSQSGGASEFQEIMTATSELLVSDGLSFLYPIGSGITVTLNCIDGDQDFSSTTGNLLNNSSFVDYTTADYPNNWTILAGSAGTTIFAAPTEEYRDDTGAVRILADAGATLISIAQSFNTAASTIAAAGGTTATLVPNGIYHVNGYVKVNATPAAGVLQVSLVDGSNAIILNDAGTSQAFTTDLTAVSTSYVNVNGAFQLPKSLPPVIKLRIRTSTAATSGTSVYLSLFSMALAGAVQTSGQGLYAGGPCVTIHSGDTATLNGFVPDTWSMAFTNSYLTSGSGLLQGMMDRFFSLRDKGLQFPFDAAPTVADSVIQ